MQENLDSFKNVINAVNATGIGFKKFLFRSNMSLDEVTSFIDEKTFSLPKDDRRDGILIIKFSDGNSYLGSLQVTEEDLSHADFTGKNGFFFEFRTQDLKGTIGLDTNMFNITDWTVGEAEVELYPVKENLKQWDEEGL